MAMALRLAVVIGVDPAREPFLRMGAVADFW